MVAGLQGRAGCVGRELEVDIHGSVPSSGFGGLLGHEGHCGSRTQIIVSGAMCAV